MTTFESCAANATILGLFQGKYATAGYQKGAREYGGPNILLGTTWPIVATAFAIAVWRLTHLRRTRSVLLLLAVLANIGDCVNVSWGRTIDPLKLRTPETYKLHFDLAIMLSQLKIGLLICAGAIRFSKVFITPFHRNLTSWGLSAFTVVWTTMLIVLGCYNVAKHGKASTVYWGLVVGQPAAYILIGLVVFTRTLQKAEDSLKHVQSIDLSRPSPLSHLRVTNNILMGITLVCAICLVAITQAEDSITNRWVLPATLLLSTIWMTAECAFEVLAQVQINQAMIASQKAEKPGNRKSLEALSAEKSKTAVKSGEA